MYKKKLFAMVLLTAFALLLSSCGGETVCEGNRRQQGVLPFNDDWCFIITHSYFDEFRDVWFRFGEGRENLDDYNGVFFEADNFLSYATSFVDIMNSISPTLLDSISTEMSEPSPFDEVTNYLYRLQINDFFMRMSVIEREDYGLLHFYMFDVEIIHHAGHSQWLPGDTAHHSLYRITHDDLSRIIQFAEGLSRNERLWTATPAQ